MQAMLEHAQDVLRMEAEAILESDEKIDIKAFLMLQNFVLLGDKMFV